MAWLPKCEELERVIGERNWLDMMIVYFDEYAYEQREFTRRLNGLIGEMNEACADRIAFVQELRSVAGEFVPAKTAVFLEEMMNKEGSRECQLADLVNEGREMVREIEFFIDALCDTLTNVIDGRWDFIEELKMLAYKFVPGKMAEFMKEIQDKDILNLMKLPILGRALFADVPRCQSDSSLFFAAHVTVLWLGGGLQQTLMKVFLTFDIVTLGFELARPTDSDDIRDQLLVLFTKEVSEDTEKMENYRQPSGQLRNGVRIRDTYNRELRTSDMSDEVVESIEILKRVQLDDMEKASRLLLMAREIQSTMSRTFELMMYAVSFLGHKLLFVGDLLLRTLKDGHNADSEMQDDVTSIFDASFLTGSVCRKSPHTRTEFPPNKEDSLSTISLRLLYNASKLRRSFIGASSQIIRSVPAINFPSWVFFVIIQRDSSVNSKGSLNLKCAVRPDGRSKEAIHKDATANTIFPSECRLLMMVFQRNVLPVPPCP
nr:hypothetical protein [Tanacetum cinerariifolium]